MADPAADPAAGLDSSLSGDLGEYFLLHASLGDLERSLGRSREARAAYRRALGLAPARSDERCLRRRLRELGA
ncbi:MAG: hypothetical protein V3T22_01570 [Planctomycetota bacterium]